MQAGSVGAIAIPLVVVSAGGEAAMIRCLTALIVVADTMFFAFV